MMYICCLDEQFNIFSSVETCHGRVQMLSFFPPLDHLCKSIFCFDFSRVMDKFVVDYPHGTNLVNMSYYEIVPTMCSLRYFV